MVHDRSDDIGIKRRIADHIAGVSDGSADADHPLAVETGNQPGAVVNREVHITHIAIAKVGGHDRHTMAVLVVGVLGMGVEGGCHAPTINGSAGSVINSWPPPEITKSTPFSPGTSTFSSF